MVWSEHQNLHRNGNLKLANKWVEMARNPKQYGRRAGALMPNTVLEYKRVMQTVTKQTVRFWVTLIYSSLLHPFGSFRPGFRNLKTKLTSRTTWWNHVVNIFEVVKPALKCYLSQRKNTWNPPNVFSIILPSSHFLENINWFQEGFGILPKIRLLCLHLKLHF